MQHSLEMLIVWYGIGQNSNQFVRDSFSFFHEKITIHKTVTCLDSLGLKKILQHQMLLKLIKSKCYSSERSWKVMSSNGQKGHLPTQSGGACISIHPVTKILICHFGHPQTIQTMSFCFELSSVTYELQIWVPKSLTVKTRAARS